MKMISVMIVDDEKLAIDDLRGIIDWEEYGFEIVTTAVNGKQALSKFNKYHPQVVLTDIKMPYMDGIELIQHLREIDTKTKIFLLTAYKDFSYAKSAIQYGISDYIIKSEINRVSFRKMLLKLRAAINYEDQSMNMIKQKRIADFFNSNTDDGQIFDKELFFTPYYYLIIEQDVPVNITGDNYTKFKQQHTDIISVLLDIDEENARIAAIGNIRNERILLVISIKEKSQNKVRQILFQYAEKIKLILKEYFKNPFTIYIDDICTDLVELKKILSNKERFYTKYLLGSGGIYDLYDKRLEEKQGDVDINLELVNGLIKKMDNRGLQSYIEQLFDQIFNLNSYIKLYNVSRRLYNILRRHNEQLSYYDRIDINAENNWHFWLSGADIRKWLIDKFYMVITKKKEVYENGYSKSVVKAIDYIHNNYYKNDLSINHIADTVHLSTGHLCAMFKKETGKTINNFITEIRIDEAKKLLNESDRKIYDISSAVGYQSSQYFSQVFHKLTGAYPAEYQKGRN